MPKHDVPPERRNVAVAGWSTRAAPPSGDARAMLLAEVRDGLARRQRELPTRLFADGAAAVLRRQMEHLHEQRMDVVEAPLVEAVLPALLDGWRPRALVDVAPSAGTSGERVLHALGRRGLPECWVAASASLPAAHEALARTQARHPAVRASLVVADPSLPVPLARTLPAPRLFTCLGNALGAYTTVAAVRALRALRATMTPTDRLLLGVDVRTVGAAIEADYYEEAVTRTAHHRHALVVAGREIGAAFPAADLTFQPRYDAEQRRVDLLLVAERACHLEVPGLGHVSLRRGESMRTGVHATFDRTRLTAMLAGVGLVLEAWHTGERGGHAVASVGVAR